MSSRIAGAAFDPTGWTKKEFTERVRLGTNAYVLQGIGYPPAAYLFHAVKLALFVLGWLFFCSFTPGLGTTRNFTSWIFEGTAFQKAFLWARALNSAAAGDRRRSPAPCSSGRRRDRSSSPLSPRWTGCPSKGGTARSAQKQASHPSEVCFQACTKPQH